MNTRVYRLRTLNVLLLVGGLVVGLGLSEALLRLSHSKTSLGRLERSVTELHRKSEKHVIHKPLVFEPDELLGWRNKPGKYRFRYSVDGEEVAINVTIDSLGTRVHSRSDSKSKSEIAVIGCSVAFGWGVDDRDVYINSVASHFPEHRFVNLAVGSYSSYQAFLSMKKYYENRLPPTVILYPFASWHGQRNVAAEYWRRIIWQHSQTGNVNLPFVSMQGEKLRFHPPTPVQPGILLRNSRLLSQLQFHLRKYLGADEEKTTRALLVEMREWAKQKGSRLIVVNLDIDRGSYDEFFASEGFSVIQANMKRNPLPYDLHPNVNWHTEVAELLIRELPKFLFQGP